MGNSLYTIYMPRDAFSRRKNAELVARSLNQLDIPASVNHRHDIVVHGHKVSGSAYKLTSSRTYHHGTMLIDADIDNLKGCLSKSRMHNTGIVSKGVDSVPSPVTNLRNYSYTVDHQFFCESVTSEFALAYNSGMKVEPIIFDQNSTFPDQVLKIREELTTWDWIFGQTPEFVNTVEGRLDWGPVHAEIVSRHGIITKADIRTNNNLVYEPTITAAISVALEGLPYSHSAVDKALQKVDAEIPGLINPENEHVAFSIRDWLQKRL
ncbi:hypothetical protein BDF20DRAFT_906358 [Mycotypha africana]|uniref:uncharacterized protein n=1 Tax=Mycotypha africana TaxID=64632 RepID=UPI002301731E|nr:uncharacterized protein BDF20DRAFT_906358 [Mycotypha africana]KAI8977173.1 hypothetical protein BDF20DRAFT_906358 [Mycotypha africana]